MKRSELQRMIKEQVGILTEAKEVENAGQLLTIINKTKRMPKALELQFKVGGGTYYSATVSEISGVLLFTLR